jgi:pimeloyl-ACP methyl ester carboxylesterase
VEGYTAAAARNLDGTLKAFLAMAAAREPVKLEPHLGEIHCPVLLLVGGVRHEGDVGNDEIVLLEERLPHFALDSVPGTGHFLYEERPEAVLGALLQVTVDTALVTAP